MLKTLSYLSLKTLIQEFCVAKLQDESEVSLRMYRWTLGYKSSIGAVVLVPAEIFIDHLRSLSSQWMEDKDIPAQLIRRILDYHHEGIFIMLDLENPGEE